MTEIRRILCPIDFSEHSRRALDHAVAIARWYKSTIVVLHVYAVAPVAAYAVGAPGFESIALTQVDRERLLEELQRFFGAESAPGVPIQMVIRDGKATTEILAQAAEMNADLLVMGTHGLSGVERFLLGSVTEKILRKAACPVLTVPRRQPDAVPSATVVFKQILCPVDFSDASMNALNYAMSLAQEADGHLTVLHVNASEFEGDLGREWSAADDDVGIGDLQRRRDEEILTRLKEAVPEAVAAYCSVETVVGRGKPWREILRIASEKDCDLIVMGAQGRGAAELMFFGSTTNQVVREATCPVLTLRAT